MTIVFYISGHGLGHAARDIEVMRRLLERAPSARVIVRTSAARWLFELNAPRQVEVQAATLDTGVVQIDSLTLDEDETARQAAAFYADERAVVEREAAFLRHCRAGVVVADIPPLAVTAARAAGVPCAALGNFTWDWIYRAFPSFDRLAPGVIARISDAYAQVSRAWRLPLHGGFESMAGILEDVPLIGRRASRDRRDTRRALDLPEHRPVVLTSFGGYGATLPFEEISRRGGLTVITADRLGPDRADPHGVVRRIDERAWYAAGFRYEDLVAAADVVLTKPGYGIISECVANDTALLYTSRGRFPEYDVFLDEMPRLLRCRFIDHADLFAGAWLDSVHALLAQPAPTDRPRIDGAAIVADAILALGSLSAPTGFDAGQD